jgi:hypothetical protein
MPMHISRPGGQRRVELPRAGFERRRPVLNGREADAWRDGTEQAVRLVETWRRVVMRAEADLVRSACGFAALDVATVLSACFARFVWPVFLVARLAALAVIVPAVVRALGIRNAKGTDADFVKAITVAVLVAGVYLAIRTVAVVEVCSL